VCASSHCIDFINAALSARSASRPTSAQALCLPWMSQVAKGSVEVDSEAL